MVSRLTKLFFGIIAGSMMLGVGGSCLPDQFWVDKWGEIVNGLLISGINNIIAPTGLAV